jgi:GDPmannose 4,6-dehydratase
MDQFTRSHRFARRTNNGTLIIYVWLGEFLLPRTALIIGVTGQDGAYLASLLLAKNYEVHGSTREAKHASMRGLTAMGVHRKVKIHSVSPIDPSSIVELLESTRPDEIYNLSGPSSVALSFLQPADVLNSIIGGSFNFLDALRRTNPTVRYYNAGSTEIFGDTQSPANEATPYRPKSPYGVAKSASVSLAGVYRQAYGLFACSGILSNHESPLRPEHFVTKKVVASAVRIANGSRERLRLGNLSIRRDWGWAPDYVGAIWQMMQMPNPEDFVIATGISHSLESFVATAFRQVNLDWREHVDCDATLIRPLDIGISSCDPTKAACRLDWTSTVTFDGLIAQMIQAEQNVQNTK